MIIQTRHFNGLCSKIVLYINILLTTTNVPSVRIKEMATILKFDQWISGVFIFKTVLNIHLQKTYEKFNNITFISIFLNFTLFLQNYPNKMLKEREILDEKQNILFVKQNWIKRKPQMIRVKSPIFCRPGPRTRCFCLVPTGSSKLDVHRERERERGRGRVDFERLK